MIQLYNSTNYFPGKESAKQLIVIYYPLSMRRPFLRPVHRNTFKSAIQGLIATQPRRCQQKSLTQLKQNIKVLQLVAMHNSFFGRLIPTRLFTLGCFVANNHFFRSQTIWNCVEMSHASPLY